MVGIVEGRGVLELLLLGGGEVRHRIHFLRGEVAVVLELPQVIVVIDVGGQAFVAGIGLLLVADGLVAEQGVFVGRHALLQLGGLGEAVVGGEVDDRLALGAALGRPDDDAVRAADTEHGRGRGVLEDGDTLDFIGVQLREGTLDAVHEDERLGAVQGSDTTDADDRFVGARHTGRLHGGHAREVTLQGVRDVRHRRFHQAFAADGGDRARDGHLLLLAIRDDH